MDNRTLLNLAIWFLLGLWLMQLLGLSVRPDAGARPQELDYTSFIAAVQSGEVAEVKIQGREIHGTRRDGSNFKTLEPGDPGLIGDLIAKEVRIQALPPAQPGFWSQLALTLLPWVLIIGVWVWFMRRSQQGGAGGLFSFGKSRARVAAEHEIKVTLADVAGVDEAKQEVAEIVEFLRNPDKFRRLGGQIPRGVLMAGPPGTGKTLLAKAIAGEAKVPFFSLSGSDFVEMFVGVGASRVRDLFEQAKKQSPCIVFIDEIDAVGRQRGAGLGGGHDEREQTLNALLVEMDGFAASESVIVIAATNRPDVLDPALLRPGRFDRQVVVGLPDVTGREQILKVHARKIAAADDVDLKVLARGTPGFSGADLANLVNEAALIAARTGKRTVDMQSFEQAKDKILMGAERRSLAMGPEEKRLTAYHEAGHAIVGRLVPEHDPVHKVTIIPRGRALGVTVFLPEKDRVSASKRFLESQISSLFGGRVAEELVFGAEAVTTGAQNDIERATAIARNMVTRWGYSDKLGPLAWQEDEGEVFLGRSVTRHKHASDDTARMIDEEVRAIVERNHERTRRILTERLDTLHAMAAALIEHETLSSEQIDDIMAGRAPRAAAPRDPDRDGAAPARPSPVGGAIGPAVPGTR